MEAGERPATPGPAFRLRYDSAEGCPSEVEFQRRVQARTQRRWEGEPPSVSVAIRHDGGRYAAFMRLESASDADATREIVADDCDEVASAMAIVVALALEAFVVQREATPVPAVPRQGDLREPEAPPKTTPWRVGVGARAVADFSLAPQASFGGVLFTKLRQVDGGPEFRFGATYRANGSARSSGREFEVTLIGVVVEACPLRLEAGAAFYVEPCASFQSGRYSARGSAGFATSRERSVWWNAAGFGVRGGAELGAGWAWELGAQALFPFAQDLSLTADVVADQRRITLFEVAPVSVELGTGVTLEFP